MTTIYLIRHAEAEGNLYRRAQGQYDSNLTAFGHKQLEKLAERFRDTKIDAVYSSDLKRAFLTAACIAETHDLPVLISEELREINMGILEDTTWADLPRLYPKLSDSWNLDPENCEIPDGESPTEAGNRLYSEISSIAQDYSEKTVVIASHGAAIRYFLHKVLNISFNDVSAIGWCDNTAITKLTFLNGSFNIEYKNNNSHLDGMVHPFVSKKWYEMTEEEIALGVNLWFKPVNLDENFEFLCSYITEIYQTAYGTSDHFSKEDYYIKCKKSLEINEKSLNFVMLKDNIIGVVGADVEKSTSEEGYIANIIISNRFRGLGFAPQIIGELVSLYRKMGKKALVSYVSAKNERSLGFYKKMGFVQGEKIEKDGFLHIKMTLDISI